MMVDERFLLAKGRIEEIKREHMAAPEFQAYFTRMAEFLGMACDAYGSVVSGKIKGSSLGELKEKNHRLYEDILPENYKESYANPEVSAARLGKEYGQLLCVLYAELRGIIPFCFEGRLEDMVIRMELFLEIYGAFCAEAAESGELPQRQALEDILYWYVSDYTREATEQRLRERLLPREDFALKILEGDLSGPEYLFYFGEYVTENEIKTWQHLSALPEETLRKIADTYTEGYRIGFKAGNKDISKKKTVNIRYRLGFEPVIRLAVENFRKMGLAPTVCRAASGILQAGGMNRSGYYGAVPNRQYDFDHKDDQALVLDKRLVQVRLEAWRECYEKYKEEAAVFGGPALVEIFGEEPARLKEKETAVHLRDAQQRLWVEYMSAAGELQDQYIKGEESSFTIIAFPGPEIGEDYPEIFDRVTEINTLDADLYRQMQQTIIDALDRGKYVIVRGMGGNRTSLRVMLHPLEDAGKQTNFENCVADVNIPVGEVFTSPLLKGTEGTLHVGRVYLNGLEYKDLVLDIRDGMVADYSCSNFDSLGSNRKYVKDNVLCHHDTLPLGEFAIGTNTTAYVVARKYKIEDRLPILIAEKTGPHFAVGDTCYARGEEVPVFNPDGKEVIARDNEHSLKRREKDARAYFNCHTDITIPYDELGEISVVTPQEEVIPIIEEGRFVLPGCEKLNVPFGQYP